MKKLGMPLLFVSLLVSSGVQAGPAFDKAINKGGVTDTDKNYLGRLKMLNLWFTAIIGLNFEHATKESNLFLNRLVFQTEDAMNTEGYSWALSAIEEINAKLMTVKSKDSMATAEAYLKILIEYYKELYKKLEKVEAQFDYFDEVLNPSRIEDDLKDEIKMRDLKEQMKR